MICLKTMVCNRYTTWFLSKHSSDLDHNSLFHKIDSESSRYYISPHFETCALFMKIIVFLILTTWLSWISHSIRINITSDSESYRFPVRIHFETIVLVRFSHKTAFWYLCFLKRTFCLNSMPILLDYNNEYIIYILYNRLKKQLCHEPIFWNF